MNPARAGHALFHDKALVIALISALAVMLLGFEWSRQYLYNVCDDSLISLHYARNVAEGKGFVFNPGERVEGYTNFLWIALTAVIYPLSGGSDVGFVKLAASLSIVLSGANVLLLYVLSRIVWREGLLAVCVTVGLCVVDNDYSVWAMQAMETQLLIFMMLGSLIFLWGGKSWASGVGAGVFMALMVMTRPDAALLPAVLFVSELIWIHQSDGRRTKLARFGVVFGVAIALYGAYFLWRYHYFGYLLPNTYYLKAGGLRAEALERGWKYLRSFIRVRDSLPLLALGAVVFYRDRIARPLLAWAVLHAAYVVYVGGDFYPGHRFFVVLVPVIALLIGHLFERVSRMRESEAFERVIAVGACVLVGWVAVATWKDGPRKWEIVRWAGEVDRHRQVAQWLGDHAPPGASIVAGFLGEHGYYARLYVYDVYGVIDPEIAHREVTTMGKRKAGHDKHATKQEMLSRNATFIRAEHVDQNLYRHGYYFDAMFPPELKEPGIWRRDELLDTGHWVENTHMAFERRPYPEWEAHGDAFARWPTRRDSLGPGPAIGAEGWALSSYHGTRGDLATGEIISAPFALRGDLLVLRIGGGHDPDLRVELIVDDEVVRRATGHDSDTLARHTWDIKAFRGNRARLRITDASTTELGHIIVDEIRQWAADAHHPAERLAPRLPHEGDALDGPERTE